jgi:hypothetical protein
MILLSLSKVRLGFVPALLLLSATAAQAKPGNHFEVRKPSPPPVAIKGKPYSGELVSVSTGVRLDGSRIKQTNVLRTEYRDSQGRMRREQVIPPVTPESLRIVTIDDPAARVEYVLEPKKKIAHRFTFKESTGPGESAARISLGPPEMPSSPANTEPLGTKIIQGMTAEGVRETLTIDDTPVHPDSVPRDIVTDTWTATGVQAVILIHTSNEGSESETRMTNLRLAAPCSRRRSPGFRRNTRPPR